MKAFKKGQKYRLVAEQVEYYNAQDDGQGNVCTGYHYAIPVYTGDFSICDCWIVNKDRDRHPGYSNSPVPLCREAIYSLRDSSEGDMFDEMNGELFGGMR